MDAWFQISADSDTYRRYRIGFWGTLYDINLIISAEIRANIADMADISNIDVQYGLYLHRKSLADIDTDSDILNHGWMSEGEAIPSH